MTKAGRDDYEDDGAQWWTVRQAAAHLGIQPAAIRAYIRDGLPVYFNGILLKRSEVTAMYRKRITSQRATRFQKPI